MNREELIDLRKQVQKVIEDGRAFPADVLSAQIVLVFEQAHGNSLAAPSATEGAAFQARDWDTVRRIQDEQAHTAHAKPFDTSPEPAKNGADSSHVTPTYDERMEAHMEAKRRYGRGERQVVRRTGFEAGAAWALTRRIVQGEPANATEPADVLRSRAEMQHTVQGEPTNAPMPSDEVLAKIEARVYEQYRDKTPYMAAALIREGWLAALGSTTTQTGENR